MEREHGHDGISDRQLRQLTTSAIHALDRAVPEHGVDRSGERPVYAVPVDDPALAVWFRSLVPDDEQPAVFEHAVNEARVFACIAGVDHEVAHVLEEIDAYHADVTAGPWPPPTRPRGRSRARALVSLALWELIASTRPEIGIEPARTGIVREPTGALTAVAASLGIFLAGDRSEEVVLSACASTLALTRRDRVAAGVASHLLLGAFKPAGKPELSDLAEAAILNTAVRLRAADDDPTAIALTHRAHHDHPQQWQTIDTLQHAVKAASAHGCYRIADELCDRIEAILSSGFRVPVGRQLEVERTEYRLFAHHQRSGTSRRRLDDGAGNGELERALREHDAAERDYERARELARAGAPGDVNDRWQFFLSIRAAEIGLIATERSPTETRRRRCLRQIDTALDCATTIATETRLTDAALVPLIKVRLARALATHDLVEAIQQFWKLHDLGWPLMRTGHDIVSISQPTRKRARAPQAIRHTVDEVAAAQQEPSWLGSVGASARGWQQARARLAGA